MLLIQRHHKNVQPEQPRIQDDPPSPPQFSVTSVEFLSLLSHELIDGDVNNTFRT
jgi:hypothetical protein